MNSDRLLGVPAAVLMAVGGYLAFTRSGWLPTFLIFCGGLLMFTYIIVSLIELQKAKREHDRIMARWRYPARHSAIPAPRKPEE